MDVVLVGLPGSGKSVIGKRLAHRHRATFIDLDEMIEREAGRAIPDIFAAEGEAGFRAREHEAVRSLGAPDADEKLRWVIATGGGTPIDPRNRWLLYRGRLPIWLDTRPEVLAQRLRTSRNVRPLIAGRDPIATLRTLSSDRERFYGAANRLNGLAEVRSVVDGVERLVEAGMMDGSTLLATQTRIGRLTIGDGIAGTAVAAALARAGAARAIVVTEPVAWRFAGPSIEAALTAAGLPLQLVTLPRGEAAKRLDVVQAAARELAVLRAERSDPLVAVGGGALGDTAGFLAATWLRGVPLIHVPTTLVAQIDSSIGGKTAVDLPEGKNLVGAFHQPTDIVIDVSFLASLPERERRAALGEAAKMAVLGDERLFELLEASGAAIAQGDDDAFASGAIAEVVERCVWAKVEVVMEDEHEETGARITLNLGHTIGHALEAAAGYEGLLHGEAVAFGLRAATRLGRALDLTPADRAARIETLLDTLDLGRGALAFEPRDVLAAMGTDKKRAAGVQRWVLPTEDGVTVTTDVPAALVERVIEQLLSPSAAAGTAGAGSAASASR